MRALYASDLHGNEAAYVELFGRAVEAGVDAVILGGDLLPHPHDPADLMGGQRAFAQGFLRPQLEALSTRAPQLRVLATPGNDDWAQVIAETRAWQADLPIRWIDGRVETVAGVRVVGAPWVPVTPFFMSDHDRADRPGWTPKLPPPAAICTDTGAALDIGLEALLARPSIEEELDRLLALSPPRETLYVIHTPPQDTLLDVMQGGVHIGSGALRAFLEAQRPALTLHGHVHESPLLTGSVTDTVGKTTCVNLGASLAGLRAAEIEWRPGAAPRVTPLFA